MMKALMIVISLVLVASFIITARTAQKAEPIEISFGVWTRGCPRNMY